MQCFFFIRYVILKKKVLPVVYVERRVKTFRIAKIFHRIQHSFSYACWQSAIKPFGGISTPSPVCTDKVPGASMTL